MEQVSNGYSQMSERGRLVLEYVELCVRVMVLSRRVGYHPSIEKVPAELLQEIEQRRIRLSDYEQAAIADFRGGGRRVWTPWVESHLRMHSGDAQAFWSFERDYKALYFEYERLYFPWRMAHKW